MTIRPITPEDVQAWWGAASKRRPLPDEASNVRLAATIQNCVGLPVLVSLKKPPSPIAGAWGTLLEQTEVAAAHWRGVQPANAEYGTAELALTAIERLAEALRACPPDWLLEPRRSAEARGWEANAAFLYRHARREWTAAGHESAKPHSADPICRFLARALEAVGTPQKNNSAGAIAQFLRTEHKAGKLPGDDGIPGSTIAGWEDPLAL